MLREYVWNGLTPVAVVENGAVYFVRVDHIGRPAFATDAAGVKVWSATYTPFGEVHTNTGAPIAIRFPGQWFQSESGLHQNWMRDYDPTTGRYLQADPLGLVDGASVYGYALQNPGRWVDPTGQQTEVGLITCPFGGPVNPLCTASAIVSACKWAIVGMGAAIVYMSTPDAVGECETCSIVESKRLPFGYRPGDQGAAEWGRNNGIGAGKGREKFHELKKKNKGSGASEALGVDPITGEVVDSNGESIGNLNDED